MEHQETDPTINSNVGIYSFSYRNEGRKERLIERFDNLKLSVEFVDSVEISDPRINPDLDQLTKRVWAIMFNHLDMISKFYQSDKEYGIFCEDDIFIHRNFSTNLSQIIKDFNNLSLDCLLIGYLLSFKLDEWNTYFNLIGTSYLSSYSFSGERGGETSLYKYYTYPDDIWGSQMYLISKNHAATILSKFSSNYANLSLTDPENFKPFSPDWTITKFGKRAVIYPILVVEEGHVNTSDKNQMDFHRRCANLNYNPVDFI